MASAPEYPHKRQRSRSNLQPRERVETELLLHITTATEGERLHEALPLPRTSKRNPNHHRASTACETCRLKKVKCDAGQPVCSYCRRHGFRCDYQSRGGQIQEQIISKLLERLAQVEERLETLSRSRDSDAPRPDRDRGENEGTVSVSVSASEIATPSSAIQSDPSSTLPLPTRQLETPISLQNASPVVHIVKIYCPSSESPDGYRDLATAAEAWRQKADYLKKTPFFCEETRPPLPEATDDADRTDSTEVLLLLDYFFEHVCPLFPIICDQVTYMMASVVVARGFQDDLPSCLILLMTALSKAYRDHLSMESGLADFQRAVRVLGRLSVQFILEYAQVQVLAALFLLKKGRLFNFWSCLHAGCTSLSTMIQRDESLCRERSPEDTKTTLRLYWICYNLERDLLNEINGGFPRSSLHLFEDHLPLPLGCDESGTIDLKTSVRTVYTFFLAEMSLKSTLSRILSTSSGDHCAQKSSSTRIEMSPLLHELNTQIDAWLVSLPRFLDWSPEPMRGACAPVATRLKMVYWFARLALSRGLVRRVLYDLDHPLPFLAWRCFQDGLLAGVNMVRVSVMEEGDIDVIMGNRLISTISLLKDAVAKGCCPVLPDGNVNEMLQECTDMLWRRLACKSEWITCRLHSL